MGVENLHCLILFLTLLIMERSSASENTREDIEIEPFQNEELMDDIFVIETSIAWKLKQVRLLKVMMKYSS
jgi:hypothetical protein